MFNCYIGIIFIIVVESVKSINSTKCNKFMKSIKSVMFGLAIYLKVHSYFNFKYMELPILERIRHIILFGISGTICYHSND